MNILDRRPISKAEIFINSRPLDTQCLSTHRPEPSPDLIEFETPWIDDDTPPATLASIIELILKNPLRLDRLIRDTSVQGLLIPRFLAIELVAFTLFAATLAVVMSSTGNWPRLTAIADYLQSSRQPLFGFEQVGLWGPWLDGSAIKMIAAYNIGLIAAVGVCLPSLYFYGLLAGVRMSMLDVVAHAIKSQAAMALMLVGILPMYVAIGLGVKVFNFPETVAQNVLCIGLILPFLAGLWGTQSLHVGFMGLADTMSPDRRCRRECFLRRLLLSWAACWTAVTPVMIYTLWEYLARS